MKVYIVIQCGVRHWQIRALCGVYDSKAAARKLADHLAATDCDDYYTYEVWATDLNRSFHSASAGRHFWNNHEFEANKTRVYRKKLVYRTPEED